MGEKKWEHQPSRPEDEATVEALRELSVQMEHMTRLAKWALGGLFVFILGYFLLRAGGF